MRKRQLEDLVIAAGTHDLDGLTDVIVEITTPPPSVDMNRLRSQLDAWLNRYLLIEVGQLDMAGIISTGMRLLHDNGLVLPGDLSLLLRVMLQLQGLGRGLQTEVRVTELLEPYMKTLLAERFDPRRAARHAARTFRAWDRLAGSLPGDIDEIVKQVRTGKLGVDFRVHDSDGAVDHLVDGLVAAAAVLASAQLISRRTGPTVGSISVPGAVAAGVGVLTWQRLVRRRRERKTWVIRARELADLPRATCRVLTPRAVRLG